MHLLSKAAPCERGWCHCSLIWPGFVKPYVIDDTTRCLGRKLLCPAISQDPAPHYSAWIHYSSPMERAVPCRCTWLVPEATSLALCLEIFTSSFWAYRLTRLARIGAPRGGLWDMEGDSCCWKLVRVHQCPQQRHR